MDERAAEARRIGDALGDIYASARLPIIAMRRDGRIVAANTPAIEKYGYSLDEFTSMRVHDLVTDGRDVDADIASAHGELERELTRRPHRKKDGSVIYVLPSPFRSSVTDADGASLLVSVLQDVTSLDAAEQRERRAREEAIELEVRTKALRAELLAADRLATVGRLVAGIAHEVNNPAALVTLNLGLLRDRIAAGDTRVAETSAMVEDCIDAMARIRDIVKDVKGFAGERIRERVDLSQLAAGVVRMTQLDQDGRANVQACFEPDVFARVRGSRLSQVLINLLLNAAQAVPTRKGGLFAARPTLAREAEPESAPRIELRTFRTGEQACIEVSDRGPGVPAHLAERIFEPFFTTRAGSGGTGLGLWLARGIIEEEGGTLALTSRPGGGAVFRVSLPAAANS